ncbi:hypothetical protein Tco_1494533, partial [Tanacetum coccineum]
NIAAEYVTAERPRRQRKKRPAVMDAKGSSHPPKKLRGDHRTSSGAATGGKSPSVLKELLASSILNVEVGVEAVETLPLITSSISTTPEREGGDLTDYVVGPNLPTIGPSKRFVISSDSSHHSSTNSSGAEVDSIIRDGTKITSLVHASMFHDSDSTETARPDVAVSSYSAKQDLSMGYRELNIENLHQVFVPQWNVLNNSLLDDFDVSREFFDHLAPLALFSQIREMDYHHLFTESTFGPLAKLALMRRFFVRKKMDADEIDALKQRNVALENEKDSLDGKVTELQSSISAKGLKLKDLNVVVSFLKSQNDGLVDQVHALETTCSSLRDQVSGYERLKEQIEEFQDAQMNIVNNKVVKLDADILEMALHLEEKFYPYLLTTISGRRWIFTRGLKLAIEKGMQSRLSAGIDHWKAGRSLADVVAYNPTAEADYNSAF